MSTPNTNTFSVIQTLATILADNSQLSKYSVKLSPSCISFIKYLMQTEPQALEQFQTLFTEITNDGGVNSKDIPIVLNLLKILYTTATSQKSFNLTLNDVISITQFIIVVIASIKGVNPTVISDLNNIIQTASTLVNVTNSGNKSLFKFSGCSCMK